MYVWKISKIPDFTRYLPEKNHSFPILRVGGAPVSYTWPPLATPLVTEAAAVYNNNTYTQVCDKIALLSVTVATSWQLQLAAVTRWLGLCNLNTRTTAILKVTSTSQQ